MIYFPSDFSTEPVCPPRLRTLQHLRKCKVRRRHSCTYFLHAHCWPTPLFTTAVARAHSCAHSCTTHRRCIFLWLQLLAQLSTVQLSDGVEWHSCHGVRRGRHCWI